MNKYDMDEGGIDDVLTDLFGIGSSNRNVGGSGAGALEEIRPSAEEAQEDADRWNTGGQGNPKQRDDAGVVSSAVQEPTGWEEDVWIDQKHTCGLPDSRVCIRTWPGRFLEIPIRGLREGRQGIHPGVSCGEARLPPIQSGGHIWERQGPTF